MNALLSLNEDLAARVCMTLAHSFWQFALLAVLVWGFSYAIRSASKQYLICVVALVFGLVLVPVTFLFLDGSAGPLKRHGQNVQQADLPSEQEQHLPDRFEFEDSAFAQAAQPIEIGIEEPATTQPAPGRAVSAARFTPTVVWQAWTPWLLGAYLLGVFFMLVRLLRGFWIAGRLAKQGETISQGKLHEFVAQLSHKWRVRVVPVLKQSESVIVPKVVGLLRPIILLPSSALAGLTTAELEMILAHELAHVRRADMWVNLVQRSAESVLFFNPALWYLSRRISTLREYCCDELACNNEAEIDARSQQMRYAETLLRVVELAGKPTSHAGLATLAASGRSPSGGNPSELRRRIARLFGESMGEPLPVGRGGVWALLMLSALLVTGSLVWAEREEGEPLVAKTKAGNVAATEFAPIAVQEFSKSGRVELLAIGTHGEDQPQWWGLKGESLENVPFTIRPATNISPLPDRQLVFRTVGIEKDAKVRWRMTPAGNRSSATVFLDGKERPANYYSHTFQRNQIAEPFRFEVGVASGPWVTMAINEGGSDARSILNKGVVISDGLISSKGEATFIVSHDFKDAQARLVAIDRQGKEIDATYRGYVAASGSSQTQYRFGKIKLIDIAKVKFQTRPYQWVAFDEVPVEPLAAKPQAAEYELPPLTDADRAVAAARAKSLGLKELQQFYVTGVKEGGIVRGMEKLPAGNAKGKLLKLWFARDQELGEQARFLKRIKTAWSDDKLVMSSSIAFPGGPIAGRDGTGAYMSREEIADGETKPSINVETRYWDGQEGWLHQSSSAGPAHAGRYAKANDFFDQTSWYDIPLVWALGDQLPWPGGAIGLEHELPVELTRYQLAGTEVVDEVECEVYEGSARNEKLWVDVATGLIKAKCRYYNFGKALPNYLSELVEEVAGRTFDTRAEYQDWYKKQTPELQAQVTAHWAKAHWHLAEPGSLFVYSDYQQIAPGVHWPLRCDRLVVHSHNGGAKYYRNTTRFQVPDETPDFDSLVKKALPQEGDKVTDWRFDVPVEYLWSKAITEPQIRKWLEEKRKEKPRRVGDWKQVQTIEILEQADAASGFHALEMLSEIADEADSGLERLGKPVGKEWEHLVGRPGWEVEPYTITSHEKFFRSVAKRFDAVAGYEDAFETMMQGMLQDPYGPRIDVRKVIKKHLGKQLTVVTFQKEGTERYALIWHAKNELELKRLEVPIKRMTKNAGPALVEKKTLSDWTVWLEMDSKPSRVMAVGEGKVCFASDEEVFRSVVKVAERGPQTQISKLNKAPMTFAEATAEFKRGSAADRRKLFDPPIPDLTVEQLREGFKQMAEHERRAGRAWYAEKLQQMLEQDKLPAGYGLWAGSEGKYDERGLFAKKIYPAILMPVPKMIDEMRFAGFPIRSLELIYQRDGESSKGYGDFWKGGERSSATKPQEPRFQLRLARVLTDKKEIESAREAKDRRLWSWYPPGGEVEQFLLLDLEGEPLLSETDSTGVTFISRDFLNFPKIEGYEFPTLELSPQASQRIKGLKELPLGHRYVFLLDWRIMAVKEKLAFGLPSGLENKSISLMLGKVSVRQTNDLENAIYADDLPPKSVRTGGEQPRLQVHPARILLDQDEIKVARNNQNERLVKFTNDSGQTEWLVLTGETLFTDLDVIEATSRLAHNRRDHDVQIKLNAQGATRTKRKTARLFAKGPDPTLRLVVLLDGNVLMAPRLNAVLGGEMVISGDFTKQRAEKIARAIRP